MQKITHRYQVEKQVQEQKLFTLSAATDTKENKPVLAQELSAMALARPLESLLRYRKVTEKLKEVKHGNILQIIESGQEENTDFTIYEYCDSKPLTEYQHATLTEKIEFFLSAARGLEATHQAKILHGGLNSSNILISTDKTLKLTGFGLNLLSDLTKITTPEEIRNVFGYLSPEGTGILRKPLDQRSDLYSLGIVFYELFSGQLPYQSGEVAELIHQHIAMTPALPSAINPEIPVVIEKMVLRLIAKDPQDRYQSASGLIYDLEEYQRRVTVSSQQSAVGGQEQDASSVSLIDFEIARQDRLRELNFSTRLIGREKELESLKANLKRATVGQGSVSLVSGEAGIGKSRLIDELRSEVHQKRGIFAGGKCYQYEFRTPYKVISEAIEAYLEKVKRQSQQEQQGVIKRIKEGLGELGGEAVKIAPALKELIGEPPALVSLEPEKEKIRFLITVTNFIVSLSNPENPLLLFLDDLQWVDDGSLEILERVMQKVPESSLMLIIGYRSNEVDEKHILSKMISKVSGKVIGEELRSPASGKVVENSESVVSGKVVKGTSEQKDSITIPLYHSTTGFITEYPIKPFDLSETAKMISQIILEPEEQVLYLAENLYERTKGNPFFTLELLRTLYEEKIIYLQDNHYSYDREQLGKAALPTNVVDIVLKRMKDISEGEKQILSAASVMGKEIDLQLLTQLSQKPFEHILSVIEHSIENQLLYRDITGKEATYFIHDRVREAFYQRIPEDEKAPMHRYIAEAIEIQHKDNLQEVLYDLAFHYAQGKVEEKALEYSLKAGRQAQASYSNTLAITLYNTAKEILEKQNKTKEAEYIDILESLGEVYRLAGKFDDSISVLKICEQLVPDSDKLLKVQIMSKMGNTLCDNGKVEESAQVLERALKVMGVHIPETKVELFISIGLQFSIQILHTIFPTLLVREEYKKDLHRLLLTRIMNRIAHIYYFSDIYKTLYYALRFINIAEKIGPCSELANAYITIVGVWGVFPWYGRIDRDFKKGIEMSQKLNDRVREGIGYAYYAGLRCGSSNKGAEAVSYAKKTINILTPLGEYWELGAGYAFYNLNSFVSGNIQEDIKINEEHRKVMKQANALQLYGWGLYQKGHLYCLIGDVSDEIIEDLKKSTILMIKCTVMVLT